MNNNINLEKEMKIKSNLLTVILSLAFLLCGITIIQAQGIFSKKNSSTTTNNKSDSGSSGGGSLYRGWGDGGNDRPSDPGESDEEEPIGEGIAILSLLAGGYALVKRNIRKKHEV